MILQVSVDLRSPEYDCGWQVVDNSPIQGYTYPDDCIPLIYDMNPWLWVQTVNCILLWLWMVPELVVWCLNIHCFICPIETILTCILIFFSLKKKGLFVRQALFCKHFNGRAGFFFFGEPWNLKSYRPGDFRESGPYSRTERYLGHFLFIKKLNPAVEILAIWRARWKGTFRLHRPNPSHRTFRYCSC